MLSWPERSHRIGKQTGMNGCGCVKIKIGGDSSFLTPDPEFSAIYRLAIQGIFLANDNDDEGKK